VKGRQRADAWVRDEDKDRGQRFDENVGERQMDWCVGMRVGVGVRAGRKINDKRPCGVTASSRESQYLEHSVVGGRCGRCGMCGDEWAERVIVDIGSVELA
jgi:hypothetical protein